MKIHALCSHWIKTATFNKIDEEEEFKYFRNFNASFPSDAFDYCSIHELWKKKQGILIGFIVLLIPHSQIN